MPHISNSDGTMGHAKTDFSDSFQGIEGKYLDFAPTYDDYKEKYIDNEFSSKTAEYGLAGELFGMAQSRSIYDKAQRGNARESASNSLARSLTGMGRQMGSTLKSAQNASFDVFSQGEQLSSGGLGNRSNLTSRALKNIESSSEDTLMGQAMSGLNAKSSYEDSMSQISNQAFSASQSLESAGINYEAAGISYDRATDARNEDYENLARGYEDEVNDYLLMLGTNFDIWGTDGNNTTTIAPENSNMNYGGQPPPSSGTSGMTQEEINALTVAAGGSSSRIGGGP
tara:strand:- start:3445 stop:4296 length:852 start_codon:yes stop_codon:yes gene_type:complete